MEPSDHTGNGKSGWKQLDSARLLLALTVVVSHANYVFLTPLGYTAALPAMEWMARYAVLGFFVLSGLVIGRSLAVRRDGFVPFMIRRVGQIYPPLLVSFLLVVAVDRALHLAGISTEALPNAGPMVNSFSYDLQRAALCLATFGFRGWLSSEANAALWSLVIEMRCYVVAGLLAQVAFARTWLGKAACILALAYVLFLLADDGADSVIVISYAAFLFGLLLESGGAADSANDPRGRYRHFLQPLYFSLAHHAGAVFRVLSAVVSRVGRRARARRHRDRCSAGAVAVLCALRRAVPRPRARIGLRKAAGSCTRTTGRRLFVLKGSRQAGMSIAS